MDTNEKDILNEENLEETVNAIAEPEVQETQETADVDTQDTEYSTIEISQSDIDEELLKYGALTDDFDPDEFSQEYSEELEDAQPEKKKLIQKPIIIAAIAFALAAIILVGTVLVYDNFFRPGLKGAWKIESSTESYEYIVFDKKGNISYELGAQRMYGTYTLTENEDGTMVLSTALFQSLNPYLTGDAIVTVSEDGNSMTIAIGEMMSLNLTKSKLPKVEVDPQSITHASADECSLTALNVDDALLGTWSEAEIGSYTFEDDGMGVFFIDSENSSTISVGIGMEIPFKYTTSDGKLFVTMKYFNDEEVHNVFSYEVDGDALVINGFYQGELKYTKK